MSRKDPGDRFGVVAGEMSREAGGLWRVSRTWKNRLPPVLGGANDAWRENTLIKLLFDSLTESIPSWGTWVTQLVGNLLSV